MNPITALSSSSIYLNCFGDLMNRFGVWAWAWVGLDCEDGFEELIWKLEILICWLLLTMDMKLLKIY